MWVLPQVARWVHLPRNMDATQEKPDQLTTQEKLARLKDALDQGIERDTELLVCALRELSRDASQLADRVKQGEIVDLPRYDLLRESIRAYTELRETVAKLRVVTHLISEKE